MTNYDRSLMSGMHIAFDEPAEPQPAIADQDALELCYQKAIAGLHYRVGVMTEKQGQLEEDLAIALVERDTEKQNAERWRRNFVWSVLIPAVLALAAMWGWLLR